MAKAVKHAAKSVKQQVEQKQVIKAVKALQNYHASLGKAKGQKQNLLEEQDPFVHLSFTLTKLPAAAPSPRPL